MRSTWGARFEACEGKSAWKNVRISGGHATIAPHVEENVETERECASNPGDLNDSGNKDTVAPRRGIVVKAEKEDAIRERADLFMRRIDKGEPDVARRVLDSWKVTRHSPGRRQN